MLLLPTVVHEAGGWKLSHMYAQEDGKPRGSANLIFFSCFSHQTSTPKFIMRSQLAESLQRECCVVSLAEYPIKPPFMGQGSSSKSMVGSIKKLFYFPCEGCRFVFVENIQNTKFPLFVSPKPGSLGSKYILMVIQDHFTHRTQHKSWMFLPNLSLIN